MLISVGYYLHATKTTCLLACFKIKIGIQNRCKTGTYARMASEPVGTDMMPSQRNECMCECEPASQPADDDVDATTFPKSESYPNTPNLMRRLTKPPNEGEFVFVDVFLKSAKEKIVP